MSGNTPNRQGGRRRRNKTDANGMPVAPRTIMVGDVDFSDEGSVENLVPAPPAREEWHDIAKHFYEGLQKSPQRLYYELSDWMLAFLLCEQISRELDPKFVGFKKVEDGETSRGVPVMIDVEHYEVMPIAGGSMSSILRAMEKLMVTEIDRRKARVEIDRGAVVEEDLGDSVVESRMQLLQGGQAG